MVGRPSASSSPWIEGRDLGIDRQPDVAQPVDRPLEAAPALVALGGERRLERLVVRVHAEPEDVELALPQAEVAGDQGVDLDAGDEGHAGRRPRRRRRRRGSRPACRGRSGREADAGGVRVGDERAGARTPSRAGGVGVQVDRRRAPAGRPASRRSAAAPWRRGCGSVAARHDLDEPLDPLDRRAPGRSPGRCRSGGR